MAYRYKKAQGMGIESREIAGIIIGIVLFAILVTVSYALGEVGVFALGGGGILFGLILAGFVMYWYAALNRRRRYDHTILVGVFGYVIGAYLIESLFPEGQFISNLATASNGLAWIVYLFFALVILVLFGASLAFAKRTDLE